MNPQYVSLYLSLNIRIRDILILTVTVIDRLCSRIFHFNIRLPAESYLYSVTRQVSIYLKAKLFEKRVLLFDRNAYRVSQCKYVMTCTDSSTEIGIMNVDKCK